MVSLNFEFVIPLKREDLLSCQTENQYCVSELLHTNELQSKVEECIINIKENGCDFILEYFGTLFSVLQNFKDLDFKFLQHFYNGVVIKGLQLIYNSLSIILEDDDLHSEIREKMLNVMKMIIYIAVEFLKSFQEKVDKIYSLVIDKKGKKNTKLIKLKEDHNWDWEENERVALQLINKIIKLPLHLLWDPPMPEKEFVRMIEDCCYGILEKPNVTSIKMKPTRDIIFEILAILITQYNNAISCKVKIVQMLKLYEHLVSILAQAVIFFVEKYNCRSLIKELIIEIIETGEELDNYVQDNLSSKAFSNFIVEIAAEKPDLILPCINLLIHNLNCDPYSMRICVLTVMSEIVINVLRFDVPNSEEEKNISEEKRKARDSFLEHLLDHIIDVNVFVRSKVLKLWQEMYKRNAVPKHFVNPLLQQTVERLFDKNSHVIKYAIQLITIILENNLYGPWLNEEVVKQKLQGLKSKLIETEKYAENPSFFKIWFCWRSEITNFMSNELKDNNEFKKEIDTSDSDIEKECIKVEDEKAELLNFISKIRKSIITQDLKFLLNSLIKFEAKYLKKVTMLTDVSDKIKYYQWILKHLCKLDDSILLVSTIDNCEDVSEIKSLIEEPVFSSQKIDLEFGDDGSIIIYCEDHLKFIESMRLATSIISKLMMGKSIVETIEAIEFFKTAHYFNLTGADEGMRNMLLLTDSKEIAIKEAAINAFKILYLNTKQTDKREINIRVVDNLISLLKKVTHEQKNALSNLIKYWVINKDVGTELVLVLWEKYSKKASNSATYDDCKAAAVLLTMYASGKPEIIRNNLEIIIKFGLGSENKKNYAFLKYTCEMFRALYGTKNESGNLIRYAKNSELIECLSNILQEQFFNLDNYMYPEISMELITTIYQQSEFPDTVCGNIIKVLNRKILNISEKTQNDKNSFKEEFLIRFIIVIGQTTFCHWQYLEHDVLNELKQRNNNKYKETKIKTKSRGKNKNQSEENITATKSLRESFPENFEDDSMAVVNERIAESIRMICENEIIRDNTIIGTISSLIIKICQNPEKYKGSRLISAASISLSKMMMISSDFCNENIQLFVTMLEKTEHSDVKINLILAFGDLTFRFPNILEPWTVYFYNRLKDTSSDVRFTALRVISHLITNEMVKVKGQMSDIALCLIDDDKIIKNHAFHLFNELSLKGNTLYNVMPDIISRLSHPDYRTTEQNFEIILKILMNLITKDRHLEALVEKLCHRLRGASDERQCIDLSFCLTLISHTDRTLQKLVDNIACYAEKLNYAKVHKNITSIIIACKKQAKLNKMNDLVFELENKIDIILTKGIDNVDADFLKPSKTPAKTPKTPRVSKSSIASTRKLRLKRTPKKLILSDSTEDSE